MDGELTRDAGADPAYAQLPPRDVSALQIQTLAYASQGAAAEAAALRVRVEELQLRLDAAQHASRAEQSADMPPAWARWKSVEDFPRDRLLFVSFSNGHYADLMMNWVQTLRVLEVHALRTAIPSLHAESDTPWYPALYTPADLGTFLKFR